MFSFLLQFFPVSLIVDDLGNITPTVELNALAMKRGETTTYHVYPAMFPHNQTTAPRKECWQIDGVDGAQPHPNASFPIPQAEGTSSYNTNQYNQYNRPQGNNMYHQQRYNYDRRQISGGSIGIAGRYGGKSDYVSKLY